MSNRFPVGTLSPHESACSHFSDGAVRVLSAHLPAVCRSVCPLLSPPGTYITRLRAIGAADSLGHRLVLVRQAGAGGMGRVYQATDAESGRPMAVKLIRHVRGESALSRFAAEAEILESLDHPAIVAYVGHGTTPDGDHYLAMEWLDGEDLGRRLAAGPLSVADTLTLGRRLASGLVAAHRAGVIHRDLKPSNVVLVGGDVARATLVDFGIARRMGDEGEGLTRTGELLGTPGYMAPEQIRGQRDLDGRVDLFALGCVLYQCLAGKPPFGGEDVMTVLARLLLEDAPRLRAVRSDVPPRVDDLIVRLLSKDGADRPASAEEVLAALDAPGLEAPARPRHWLSRAALGLALGAAGLAATMTVARLDRPTPSAAASPSPSPVPTPSPLPSPALSPSSALSPSPTPPPLPRIHTAIATEPVGAHVLVDGVEIGLTPLEAQLPSRPGTLTLTLRLAGYQETRLRLAGDQPIAQHVVLRRLRQRPPARVSGAVEPAVLPPAPPPVTPPAVARPPSDPNGAINPYD
jgi:serine/threonine protein kinase